MKPIMLAWWIWALALVSLVAGLAYCSAAAADSFSATNEDGKLTLSTEPCTKAGPWFEKWKSGRWMYKGKLYDACWSVAPTRDGGQTVVVIDSDGTVSQLDPRHFRPDGGV